MLRNDTGAAQRRGILFCMRFADDQGFVWKTVGRLRDMVAAELEEFDCHIAFPELTGRSVHRFEHLRPVELDCYVLNETNKARLRDFVRDQHITAIVYMSALPATLDMAFLRGLGLVTVNTEEDGFDPTWRDFLPKRLSKIIMRRVLRRQLHDLHIANSIAQGEWLAGYAQVPRSRIAVIPNGIDNAHFVPAPPGERGPLDPARRWVICAGQARAEKRVDLIMRCAARIFAQDKFADVGFVYVGDGPMMAEWRQLAHRLGIESRFVLAGQQADPVAYFQAAYLMVHAAERESFGLVLAEAMACEVPVVACAAAGPKEIIDDGRTGRVVPIDDEPAFAEAVESYLRQPVLAAAHGQAGRRRVLQHYSIHRQAHAIAGAIRRAAAR